MVVYFKFIKQYSEVMASTIFCVCWNCMQEITEFTGSWQLASGLEKLHFQSVLGKLTRYC
jgi:hypothetical protein